jgi:hypothetical protein
MVYRLFMVSEDLRMTAAGVVQDAFGRRDAL